MTKSRAFLFFCLSLIAGLFLSSIVFIPQLTMLGFLIAGIFLISIFWEHERPVVIGFSILFFVLGIWRLQAADLDFQNNGLKEYAGQEEKIILLGIIDDEPKIGQKSIGITLKAERLTYNNQDIIVSDRVLINISRYPEYHYGDKIKVKGLLEIPAGNIDGFNYKNYLKKEGISSTMNWPETELVGEGFGNPIMKALFSFKNKFEEGSRRFISLPQEGILEALVFGDETNISKDFKEKLNLSGTRHIAAVSGMNITIIASLILSSMLSLGLWRKQAFYVTVFLLVLYVLMVGASASAVRAGIMAFLFLLAQHLGRIASAGRAIVFAAAPMLFQSPFLLLSDVGFQLSFLAILGIVYLQPIFSNWLSKIPDFKLFPLKSTLVATLSAQVFTMPILIYNFGYISLAAPFANILIVPFLAPVTILVFIFGLSTFLFLPLAFILFWPTWLFLTYIVSVIDYFSKIPFASMSFENISVVWLVIFYLLIGFISWKINKKYSSPVFLR
ncbi:MAG: ComEC/Rec2 family competence protein [Candidatus Nealsonbacteria bacterium]|nr:ComEC/Rec2 family competence protein [Candidatus Nealsonbacteria bacterium]